MMRIATVTSKNGFGAAVAVSVYNVELRASFSASQPGIVFISGTTEHGDVSMHGPIDDVRALHTQLGLALDHAEQYAKHAAEGGA